MTDVDISRAVALFTELAETRDDGTPLVYTTSTGVGGSDPFDTIFRLHESAVEAMRQSVGAEKDHPVVGDIRRVFRRITGSPFFSQKRKAPLEGWVRSTELQEQANLWAALARLPAEYAREMMDG
jgi:hypothetical protein